jgi:hypothetical protein
MAKTYPTIGPFTAGDILTAATMTDIETNLTNQRVPPSCMRDDRQFFTQPQTRFLRNRRGQQGQHDTDGMWSRVRHEDHVN